MSSCVFFRWFLPRLVMFSCLVCAMAEKHIGYRSVQCPSVFVSLLLSIRDQTRDVCSCFVHSDTEVIAPLGTDLLYRWVFNAPDNQAHTHRGFVTSRDKKKHTNTRTNTPTLTHTHTDAPFTNTRTHTH
jgi:hypothetical protein